MDAELEKELTRFVVTKLANGEDADTVIGEVCRRAKWNWPQSTAFVDQVRASHRQEITGRRLWILAVIGVVIIAAGASVTLVSMAGFFPAVEVAWSRAHDQGVSAMLRTFFAAMANTPVEPRLLVFGLLMFFGGLWGTRQAFIHYLSGHAADDL